MKKQERYNAILSYFQKTMSDTETELRFSSAYELLVAVILSAQCTDKRINQVTPRLFHDFPTPKALSVTTPDVVYDYIRSVSYPNNKAKHLVGMAKMLIEKFHGEVPSELNELTQLPGVGRKTANVIQAVIFKKAALAVDTHVFRVSHRLGLVSSRCTTPYSVEIELKKHIPENLVASSHYWLLLHGRYTCTSRNPHCDKCGLAYLCNCEDKKKSKFSEIIKLQADKSVS